MENELVKDCDGKSEKSEYEEHLVNDENMNVLSQNPKYTKITPQLVDRPLSNDDQDVLEELFKTNSEMLADFDDESLSPPNQPSDITYFTRNQ